MKKQLEGVKIGDMIKVVENYGNSYSLHTVERVTATRAICGSTSFMIDSGANIGTRKTDHWSIPKYGEIVPESKMDEVRKHLETRVRISRAQAKVKRIVINEANLDAAEKLLDMEAQ